MTFLTLERLRLNTKLLLAIGCVLVVAFAIGLLGILNTRVANDKMDGVYNNEVVGITHIKEANIFLTDMAASLRQMMLAVNTEQREAAFVHMKQAEKSLHLELAEAKKGITQAAGLQLVADFELAFSRYVGRIDKAVVFIRQEPPHQSLVAVYWVSSAEYTATATQAHALLGEIATHMATHAKDVFAGIRAAGERGEHTAIGLITLGTLLGAVLSGVISRTISAPIDQLNTNLQALAEGRLQLHVPYTDYNNELGEMARSVKVLQASSQAMSDISWVKESANTITQAVAGIEDEVVFASTLLSKLARKIDAPLAAFYRWDASSKRYHLQGGYGYQMRPDYPSAFAMGEGLIGQCALEGSTLTLSDLPPSYLRVASGLGDTMPTRVLLKPVVGQGHTVLAVMEFATFAALDARSEQLLQELLPLIALSLEKLDRNAVAKDLLLETQRQSADLLAQADSLRESEEELRAQRDQLAEQMPASSLRNKVVSASFGSVKNSDVFMPMTLLN